MVEVAISNGEIILIVVLAAVPVAAIAFAAGAGNALRQVGKGRLGVEFEHDVVRPAGEREAAQASRAEREDEIRQLLEAKAYRQRERGESPVDVDAELGRLLAESEQPVAPETDPALREEVRQLVVARNERRLRQGKQPLDVEHEVERQLRELADLDR